MMHGVVVTAIPDSSLSAVDWSRLSKISNPFCVLTWRNLIVVSVDTPKGWTDRTLT